MAFEIFQGSVATYLRHGGLFKFIGKSPGERILKIGRRTPKLCMSVE